MVPFLLSSHIKYPLCKMSDSEDSSNPNKYLIPVTSDGDPINWDNKPATLAGILYETRQLWQCEGLFQAFSSPAPSPCGTGASPLIG